MIRCGAVLAEEMAELLDQEFHAIAEKPVLQALCGDIRAAANALPIGTVRRLELLDHLVSFSSLLHHATTADLSEACADALRNALSVPKRVA